MLEFESQLDDGLSQFGARNWEGPISVILNHDAVASEDALRSCQECHGVLHDVHC